jgi:hypothetical protein
MLAPTASVTERSVIEISSPAFREPVTSERPGILAFAGLRSVTILMAQILVELALGSYTDTDAVSRLRFIPPQSYE